MIRKVLFPVTFFLLFNTCFAQNRQYLLYLKDKGTVANSPALSAESIAKHKHRGIALQETDMPVANTYLQALQQYPVEIVFASRWFNMVQVNTALGADELTNLFPFVQRVQQLPATQAGQQQRHKFALPAEINKPQPFAPAASTAYGVTETQNKQLRAECLHDLGYNGKNVLIAQFDTGFLGVDTISAYDSARIEGRFVATRNFVNAGQSVYSTDSHGSMVFSTMAGNKPTEFVGMATGARYALALTENLGSETHQEELNWLAAAEWADSLGADIIQSSLSYKYFDPGQGDYTETMLDGKTAIITNAARMAAGKGILVVNSAGNDGTLPPPLSRKISPPCDADSVLAVGSVTAGGVHDIISSVGPTADGRIKPDVSSMGSNTYLLNNRGNITQFSGTSFAAPLVSGLAACLMQANPQRAWWEVWRAIVVSSSQVNNPDNLLGFGIPNACKADSLLKTYNGIGQLDAATLKQKIQVFPSTTQNILHLDILDPAIKISSFLICDVSGRELTLPFEKTSSGYVIDAGRLNAGMYLLQVSVEGKKLGWRFIKN